MKKIFTMILLSFFYCSSSFSESYYFKDCKISNAVTANYTINFEKNIIEVELKVIDGNVQNFSDKIKSVQKDKIVSEKIKSAKGKDLYYQYFLCLFPYLLFCNLLCLLLFVLRSASAPRRKSGAPAEDRCVSTAHP